MLFYLKLKIKLLYITLLIFLLLSCNKNKNQIIISGLVTDTENSKISDVNIALYGKIIESGKWTNSFSEIATTKASSSGEYTLKLESVRVSEYKLTFTKDKYIDDIRIMQPNDITTENDNIINVVLDKKSFIKIQVKNQYPVNENDNLSLKLIGEFKNCSECCNDEKYTFLGTNINQNVVCVCPGSQNITLNWDILKTGSISSHSEILYVNDYDTTNYIINY